MRRDRRPSQKPNAADSSIRLAQDIEDHILLATLVLAGCSGFGLALLFQWPADISLLVVMGCVVLAFAYREEGLELEADRERIEPSYAVQHGVASDIHAEATQAYDTRPPEERKAA